MQGKFISTLLRDGGEKKKHSGERVVVESGWLQVAMKLEQQGNQRRAENDQLAWLAAAAATSGITLIRVKKRNFP